MFRIRWVFDRIRIQHIRKYRFGTREIFSWFWYFLWEMDPESGSGSWFRNHLSYGSRLWNHLSYGSGFRNHLSYGSGFQNHLRYGSGSGSSLAILHGSIRILKHYNKYMSTSRAQTLLCTALLRLWMQSYLQPPVIRGRSSWRSGYLSIYLKPPDVHHGGQDIYLSI